MNIEGDRMRSPFFVVPNDGSVVKYGFCGAFEHFEFLIDRSHRGSMITAVPSRASVTAVLCNILVRI
jgi:hypothetical protein